MRVDNFPVMQRSCLQYIPRGGGFGNSAALFVCLGYMDHETFARYLKVNRM